MATLEDSTGKASESEPAPAPNDDSALLSWQARILANTPSGIDIPQLERFLKLTPTERLDAMQRWREDLEALRRGNEPTGTH